MLSKLLASIFSFDQIAPLYSIIVGPVLLSAALFARFYILHSVGLLTDAPVIIGGVLCLLETVPFWRSTFHAGFLFGYSAALAGLALGFFSLWWWMLNPVFGSDAAAHASVLFATPVHTDLSVGLWAGQISFILMFAAAALVALQCAFKVYSHIRGKSLSALFYQQRNCCCLAVLAWVTLCYCVAVALFIATPNVAASSDFFKLGWIQEAPYQAAKTLCLMSSVMLSGALVCWLSLVYLPFSHCCAAHFLSFGLTCVLISHVLLTIAGVAGFSIWTWSVQPQRFIWLSFLTSSCLLVFVTGLHVSVHYSTSSSQSHSPIHPLRLDGHSVHESWTSLRQTSACERDFSN